MIEKLDIVQQRFIEVSDLIIQPDIIADQKQYIQLNKEYKDLNKIVAKAEVYRSVIANIEEAETMIKEETDSEMIDMAKMQLEEAKEQLPQLEEEIRFLLFPKTLRTGKMWWLKFEQELEETKPVFLLEIFIGCTPSTAKIKGGK